MNVINYIAQNWDFILLIVAAAAAVVFAIFKGNKSVIMKMLFSLVTEAEKEYGASTGALKLSSVITEIYPKLPAVIKAFISIERLTAWVEEALATAKGKWQSNAAISEYIEQKPEKAAEDAQEPAEGADQAEAE